MNARLIFRIRHGAQRARMCLGLVVTLGAAACAPSPEPAPTVEYYRAHRAEREAQLDQCRNDPGRLAQTARCQNAKAAARLEDVGSLRQLPPMGLPPVLAPEGKPRSNRSGSAGE